MTSIPFIDLKAQQERIRDRLNARIQNVLDHGGYIMGPEVKEFETALSEFCQAKHSITCANGTDALTLALMAENIAEGDAVFVPSFTFIATAEAAAQLGATPFFVDVCEESFNLSADSLKQAIKDAKQQGLKPRAVISVDLFGLPCNYTAITEVCKNETLTLIADAAQGFGGSYNGKRVGTFGDYTTTSFFPAKPLGCYGDGGAIFCEDDEKAALLRSLRIHGKGIDKYDNVRIGLNSRLDTLQAAILIEKIAIFSDELDMRQKVAERYNTALADIVQTPFIPNGYISAWAQYTIRCENRTALQAHLKEHSIPSAVYYPLPMHQQSGYRNYPRVQDLSVSEKLSQEVISLPMSAYVSPTDQDRIIDAVLTFFSSQGTAG